MIGTERRNERDPLHRYASRGMDGDMLLLDLVAVSDVSPLLSCACADPRFPDRTTLEDASDPVRLHAAIAKAGIDGAIVPELSALVAEALSPVVELPSETDFSDRLAASRRAVSAMLSDLRPREEALARMRFGIDGRSHVLEDVAKAWGVTRQRIQQMEQKLVQKLGHPSRAPVLKAHLDLVGRGLLAELTDGATYVPDDRRIRVQSGLDGITALALAVVSGGLRGWLDAMGSKCRSGWFVDGWTDERRLRSMTAFEDLAKRLPLPRNLESMLPFVPEGARRADVLGWIAASGRLQLRDGYVVESAKASTQSKIARLHHLAMGTGRRSVGRLELEELHALANPEDDRSDGPRIKAFLTAPHLFVRMHDDELVPIDDGVPRPPSPRALDGRTTSLSIPAPSGHSAREDSYRAALSTILVARGPLPMSALVRELAAAMGTDVEAAQNNATMLLDVYARFRRLAPGIYADAERPSFPENVPPPAFATSERSAVRYAVSLRGGEGRGFYPLWTADYERHLVRRAATRDNPALLASLLHVVDPSSWPCSDAERDFWSDRKAEKGAWRIAAAVPVLPELGLPSPDAVFSAMVHAQAQGSIGIAGANRTSGSPSLTSSTGARVLAFLAAVGAVQAPADWTMPHRATAKCSSILVGLHDELSLMGGLDWERGLPAELLDEALGADMSGTWISTQDLKALLGACSPAVEFDETEQEAWAPSM